jgi:Na+/proline symporter
VAGGLSAVIWTDFVQTIIMVIGAFILSGFGEYYMNVIVSMKKDYLVLYSKIFISWCLEGLCF